MINAVFFDIDGTLISGINKQYPPSIPGVLDRLRKNNVKVFIATGRPKQIIRRENLLGDLKFDAYVTLNGQYCYNEKETIHLNPIHPDAVRSIYEKVTAENIPCSFVEKELAYINICNERVIKGLKSLNSDPFDVGDPRRALENPIFQMSPYVRDEDHFILPEAAKKYCKVTRWCREAFDLMPITGGKADGIDRILAYYNIPLEQSMAFGDAANDIEMLEHVAIGVAMGNAEETAKKASDYITDDVDHDGVLHALEHFQVI